MYILRRHFGIGAYEAEHVLPAWERAFLLRRYSEEVDEVEGAEEDYSEVPEELMQGG